MKKVLVFFSIILSVQTGRAQLSGVSSDTIIDRVLKSTMNDSLSTEFDYELGQMRHVTSSGYSFIKFADSSGNPESGFLVSKPFTVMGSGDSLYYSRLLWFDNSTKYLGSEKNLTQAQIDSVMKYIMSKYDKRFIYPDTNYFNSTSHVKYIVGLYKASDSSLLAPLDTLDCFLSGDTVLRYENYPRSLNWRKIRLSDYVTVGTSLFLRVTLSRISVPLRGSTEFCVVRFSSP